MSRADRIVFPLAVAVLYLFVKGYSFNDGDQAEHLPQVYQLIDPALYQGDYFVNASNGQFTVRHWYIRLTYLMAVTVGLEWGCFLLTLLCAAAVAHAWMGIAWHFFRDRWAAVIAPVLVLVVFDGFTVGGNRIMDNSFISGTLATAFANQGLLMAVRERWLRGGGLIGVGTLFQALVGLQLFLLLAGYMVIGRRWSGVRSVCRLSAGYLPIAALVLAPTFHQQFGPQPDADLGLYYRISYHFRNYLHYLPSHFPVTDWLRFMLLLGLGVGLRWVLRPWDKALIPWGIGLAVLGMVAYSILMEILGFSGLGRLQWFKTAVWVVSLSATMAAGVAGMLLHSILPYPSISRALPWIASFSAVGLLVMMLNSAWLPERIHHRWDIGNRPVPDLERMHLWIAANTPVDAMTLTPPNDNAFSCRAKRPMPIHFQAVIHTPQFMLEWHRRFRAVYGLGVDNLPDGLNARQAADSLYQSRNYKGNEFNIRYRLDHAPTCRFAGELGPIAHREGDWLLTEFIPDSPMLD